MTSRMRVLVLFGADVFPARERSQLHFDDVGEVGLGHGLAFLGAAAVKEGGAVDPLALHLVESLRQMPRGRHTGPVERRGHQVLFAAVVEEIEHALDLGELFLADRDASVPAAPHRSRPVVQSPNLAGEVALHVLEEEALLLGIREREEAVPMVREKDEGVNRHRLVELQRTAWD
jgi:hypothetical protein